MRARHSLGLAGALARWRRRPTPRRRPGPSSATSRTPPGAPCPAPRSPPPTWARSSRARPPTDADGAVRAALLPVGDYKVDVTLTGFKNFSQTGHPARGRAATRASTRRSSPGGVEEVVSVVADAPLVETDVVVALAHRRPERGAEPPARQPRPLLAAQHHRRRHQQRQLELAGRARAAHHHQRLAAARQIGSVNFQLDGGNNTAGLRGTGNPAPNPEAVQEFRVITNSYAAEYGRYQAGVVDVVTKSGTNQFHGAVVRVLPQREAEREALGAAGRHRRPRTRSTATSSAAAFGGPIQKDKTFFFVELLGPAPGGDLLPQHRGRADRARARGRLLAVGASSRATR